jgi:hypothetical protein
VIGRSVAAPVYAGAAFLFGMALGERGELGVVQHLFAAVIPIATIVMVFVAKQGRAYVAATGLSILLGLLLGQRQFESAWRECIDSGERVRAALDIALPCRCGFRPTILHYLSNDRGFRLWMTNDRQTFVATDKRPFTASGRSSVRPRT